MNTKKSGANTLYQKIHDDLIEMIQTKKGVRLSERRLNIGQALKQLKDSGRVKMRDILKASGLKRTCVNTLMQVGEMNTSRDRFLKIVKALQVPVDEFVGVARETSHYNFYHLKANAVPCFKYKTHEVEVYSPPSFSKKDFLWCLVRIHPGKTIDNLIHETMEQVGGFVTHGHLNLKYGDKNHAIHTNQSFFFDPKIKHAFANQASSGTTEFYLMYQLKRGPAKPLETRGRKISPTSISTATLIEQIRKELSPDPNRLMSMPALASLSGIEFDSLVHLSYRKTKIIPFEKIDRLANLTDYSFEHIIQKAENRYQGWVNIFTDQDKAAIDMSMRHGVHFNSHTGIGIGKRKFSVADVIFDSWKESGARKEWKYHGVGFIGIGVQRGTIGIQYGRQPLEILKWGEFLYVNADVPVTVVNLLSEEKAQESGDSSEAKIILVSSPPLF